MTKTKVRPENTRIELILKGILQSNIIVSLFVYTMNMLEFKCEFLVQYVNSFIKY